MKLIITHKNMGPFLQRLLDEPEFRIGSSYKPTGDEWYRQIVTLEMPAGELCKDGLVSMALVGLGGDYQCVSLTGEEGFEAQGLEGKVTIRKPLFNALMNLRDILPEHRGRIVCDRNPLKGIE